MKLHRLNVQGIAALRDDLLNDKKIFETILDIEKYSSIDYAEPVDDIELEKVDFKSRYEFACYLNDVFANINVSDIYNDIGLWSWLTVFYFENVFELKNDVYKIGDVARYIPEPNNFRKMYRHLLLGPYLIYRAHIDDPRRAMCVLTTKLNAPGEAVEQIASRQEIVVNHQIIQALTSLYYDENKMILKKGAGKKSDGSVRRMVTLLDQFDLTYDLSCIYADDIINMLPKEFDKFKNKAA